MNIPTAFSFIGDENKRLGLSVFWTIVGGFPDFHVELLNIFMRELTIGVLT